MKYLLAALLLAPLIARADPPVDPRLLAAIEATSDPTSGQFPASCQSDMATVQMGTALQRWYGNRMGDQLVSLHAMPYGESHFKDGYSCYLQVEWRDQGAQSGELQLDEYQGRIFFKWNPG